MAGNLCLCRLEKAEKADGDATCVVTADMILTITTGLLAIDSVKTIGRTMHRRPTMISGTIGDRCRITDRHLVAHMWPRFECWNLAFAPAFSPAALETRT